jgi:hypothetical protein
VPSSRSWPGSLTSSTTPIELNRYSGQFGQIIQTVSQPTTIYGSALQADGSSRVIEIKAKFTF